MKLSVYREYEHCPCCHKPINKGHLLCWGCFKTPKAPGHVPYKYWQPPTKADWDDEQKMVDGWIDYTRKLINA